MNQTQQKIALLVALAFHISGFIAMGILKSASFVELTPLNFMVCAWLLYWTQHTANKAFFGFCMAAFLIGFFSEVIGVNTGIIFGDYAYGTTLGPKWKGVPYTIGLQWVVVTYCSGISLQMLWQKLLSKGKLPPILQHKAAPFLAVVAGGSLLAVLFDWVLEPMAIGLNYWSWKGGKIPFLNYATWWLISMLILVLFYFLPFKKQNLFAVRLFVIQILFFIAMRMVL